jgi:hypothetical protein
MTGGLMITIDSVEFRQLMGECAILRGRGRPADAIVLVEPQLARLEPDAQEVALLQMIYAASEAGMRAKMIGFAKKLAVFDPNIPSVKKALGA